MQQYEPSFYKQRLLRRLSLQPHDCRQGRLLADDFALRHHDFA
jgi:hypothetical protein